MYYIELQDLAPNLLIEKMEVNDLDRFVTYNEIDDYGKSIIDNLNKKGMQAQLILSRYDTSKFYWSYSNFFKESKNNNGEPGVKVLDNINRNDLINRFRSYLDLNILLSMIEVYKKGEK